MRNLVAAFARNTVFANILLVIIVLTGAIAALLMVRETFPEMQLDIVTVRVPWPGADPEEVEEGICRKIEEHIDGIEGIKRYSSTSGENAGTVVVEVSEDYDVDDVKERVRNAVDSIPNFPEEAEKPIVEEVLLRREVLKIALYGEQATERDLKQWAERVKDELRTLPEISQVQVLGSRDYEIGIEVSEERLREAGLTFEQVARAVRGSSMNLAGGTVRTEGEDIRLRTVGRKYTGGELAKIVVVARPGGDIVTLDQIAAIKDAFTEDLIESRFDGHSTVTIAVLKTKEEDALAIAKAVKNFVAEKQESLPRGMHMTVWGDTSKMLDQRINLLVRNGLIGMMVVLVSLWLFLDLRLSFWAGMGMPISIAGALGIMWLVGATINMISLFALILVLGIIVDDAIVVGEAIYVARKNGAPPLKAAVDGVCEVGMPIFGAVSTTILAFIPLAFMGGIMGKFMVIMPIVVISCLVISLVECMILLPAHLSHLPDPNHRKVSRHPLGRLIGRIHNFTNQGLEWFVEHAYAPFLGRVLKFRYVSLATAIAILVLALGLLESGIMKQVFFPKLDADEITATVEFPNGTPLSVTEAAVKQLEDAFRRIEARTPTPGGEPLVKHMFSLAGSTISDDRPRYGNNLGSVRLELLGTELRGNIYSEDLMAEWQRETGEIPGALSMTFVGMNPGPPGAAIEIWLQGPDNIGMGPLLAGAGDLKEKLGTYEGVYQIQHDFRPGKNEMRFELKPEARTLGLTVADLARQVYAGYFGEEAIRLQRGRDDIRVRVRYTSDERSRMSDLGQVRIRTPQGAEVPLLSVANVEFGPGYANIERTDGMRRVAVTAEVTKKANTQEILKDLNQYFEQLRTKYPAVQVAIQGEQENMRDSLIPLGIGYVLAMLGIFIIIATIFRSYLQPLLIMLTVPFGIVGALLGHFVMRLDVSFMSFLGMVALSGVVVNDAIVLIECINSHLSKGLPFAEAVRAGGARRFRAIFLTTVSTVGGLMPLILEKDMQAQFLIPMAVALAGGVAFATLLTLLLLPCLLNILNDLRRVTRWTLTRKWPTPEEVEPALLRNRELLEEMAERGIPDLPEPQYVK